MSRKWVLISVGVVFVGLAIAGVSLLRRKAASPALPSGAVSLPGPEANEPVLTGMIRPQRVIGVAASSPGLIESFLVEPGQQVAAGQPLVRVGTLGVETLRDSAANAVERAQDRVSRAEVELGNARLEQSRADAEAQRVSTAVELAQKEYQKETERLAKGATPRRVFEAAERNYTDRLEEYKLASKGTNAAAELVATTQRTLENARRDLDEKTQRLEELDQNSGAAEVVSPVDGWVAGHNGEPGTLAQEQGDRLVQIATDLVSLEIPLEPEPPVLNRVKPGVRATIHVAELNQPIDGEVKRIDGTIVVVQFTSPSPKVRPGMKAEVSLKLP